MKKSLFVLLALVVSSTAGASTYAPGFFPVAEKIVGPAADPLLVCTIMDGRVAIKRKGQRDRLLKKGPGLKYDVVIARAQREPIVKALHVMETVPNVYYGALVDIGTGTRKVLLSRDASALEYRDGKASAELIEMIDRFCPAK